MLFYLVAYAAVNLGGFGAFAALSRHGREPLSLSDLAGLSDRQPVLAAALTFFLDLAGRGAGLRGLRGQVLPVRGRRLRGLGGVALAIVGVLMSVVSAYYYLRPVVAMYMRDPLGEDDWGKVAPLSAIALAASAGVVLVLGVYPAPLLALARQAAHALL